MGTNWDDDDDADDDDDDDEDDHDDDDDETTSGLIAKIFTSYLATCGFEFDLRPRISSYTTSRSKSLILCVR